MFCEKKKKKKKRPWGQFEGNKKINLIKNNK
jgi:hypothetical protein